MPRSDGSDIKWWRASILYDSGQTVQFVTDKLHVKWNRESGTVESIEWGECRDFAGPVMVGIAHIIAVWQEPA